MRLALLALPVAFQPHGHSGRIQQHTLPYFHSTLVPEAIHSALRPVRQLRLVMAGVCSANWSMLSRLWAMVVGMVCLLHGVLQWADFGEQNSRVRQLLAEFKQAQDVGGFPAFSLVCGQAV